MSCLSDHSFKYEVSHIIKKIADLQDKKKDIEVELRAQQQKLLSLQMEDNCEACSEKLKCLASGRK